MRIVTLSFFGLTLAVSALALGAVPASALETQPSAIVARESMVTLADWGSRCRRWRIYCRERYPALGLGYRRCLLLHACGR